MNWVIILNVGYKTSKIKSQNGNNIFLRPFCSELLISLKRVWSTSNKQTRSRFTPPRQFLLNTDSESNFVPCYALDFSKLSYSEHSTCCNVTQSLSVRGTIDSNCWDTRPTVKALSLISELVFLKLDIPLKHRA